MESEYVATPNRRREYHVESCMVLTADAVENLKSGLSTALNPRSFEIKIHSCTPYSK